MFTLIMKGQQVNDLEATQEGDKIVISYSIKSEDLNQKLNMSLECSTDGGRTFKVIPKTISGDLTGVTDGTNKRVVWDVLKDLDELAGNNIVFRMIAITDESSGSAGTFTDKRDRRTYKWVRIGEQIWMAENLAWLPSVSQPSAGSNSVPYYYVYGYNGTNISAAKATSNYSTYGVLYNWTAASTACPEGWHLPTDDEWKILEKEIGIEEKHLDHGSGRGIDQAKFLKTQIGWGGDGIGGINSTGFSAIPGGGYYKGSFGELGWNGYWWSSTLETETEAWYRTLVNYGNRIVRFSVNNSFGYSVRCLRD